MIRVVLFFILVGLLALAGAWMADRPGEVEVVWLGWHIETSVMMAAAAVAALAALAAMLWSLVRLVLRSPERVSRALADRRRAKAHRAISKGLIAIGAGDARAARKYAAEAEPLAKQDPLVLLLHAQTAQLSGQREAAEQAFQAMAARRDTRLLGLRGLYVEAQRRQDSEAAQRYAEEAVRAASAPWALQAVLDFRCAAGDWVGALDALERSRKGGLVDKATYQRRRAVLLTARAIDTEASDRAAAKSFAYEAVKLAPALVPAAALAGRLAAESGEMRKGSRILDTAWRAGSHPDLADAYVNLRPGDSARDRLARVQSLVRLGTHDREAALALARAAIDARELALAREALAPLLREPTRRVAMLMAEIEDLQGDEGRAREWMGRALRAPRDPAWTADGVVSERWLPISPVTGRLDAFEWRVPVAELPGPALVETYDARPPARIEAIPAEIAPAVEPPDSERPAPSPPAAAPAPEAAPQVRPQPRPRAVDPVIPLVHAPDDPGPDVGPETKPAPQGFGSFLR
jgi:HemY protein